MDNQLICLLFSVLWGIGVVYGLMDSQLIGQPTLCFINDDFTSTLHQVTIRHGTYNTDGTTGNDAQVLRKTVFFNTTMQCCGPR